MAGRELTGNHYLSFPEIQHGGGAIPSVTALHSALAGVLSWSGHPLLRPTLAIGGRASPLDDLHW